MFVLAHLSDPHLAPLPTPRSARARCPSAGSATSTGCASAAAIHRAEVLARARRRPRRRKRPTTSRSPAISSTCRSPTNSRRRAPGSTGWATPHDVTLVPGNHDAYVRAAAALAERALGRLHARRRAAKSVSVRAPARAGRADRAFDRRCRRAVRRDRPARTAISSRGSADILPTLARERLFRVVLIHHPPVEGAQPFPPADRRRARCATCSREHGAELVLHGHHHEASLRLARRARRPAFPCVGVPSASGAPGRHDDPAGYNLYEIDGAPGAWRCTVITRGFAGTATRFRKSAASR